MDKISLPRLGFVHIPKTAGTSLTTILSALYGPETLYASTTLDYQHISSETLANYKYFKGHSYRKDYSRFPPGTKLFSVFRDPYQRARSYHRYLAQFSNETIEDEFIAEAVILAAKSSLLEFVRSSSPFLIEQIVVGQIRQFLPASLLDEVGHRSHLPMRLKKTVYEAFCEEITKFDYIMTTELVDVSFPAMMRDLGLPCTQVGKLNATSPKQFNGDTGQIRAALAEINAVEFDCYDLVRGIEATRLAKGRQI